MQQVGKELNLKGHMAGLNSSTFLYGPADIECHLGKDNRYYVIDFARLFPPTAESVYVYANTIT
jgi:hypothetical protein